MCDLITSFSDLSEDKIMLLVNHRKDTTPNYDKAVKTQPSSFVQWSILKNITAVLAKLRVLI